MRKICVPNVKACIELSGECAEEYLVISTSVQYCIHRCVISSEVSSQLINVLIRPTIDIPGDIVVRHLCLGCNDVKVVDVVVDIRVDHHLVQGGHVNIRGGRITFRCHGYLATTLRDQPDAFGYVKAELSATICIGTDIDDVQPVATW